MSSSAPRRWPRYLRLDPTTVREALVPILSLLSDLSNAHASVVSVLDDKSQQVVCHRGAAVPLTEAMEHGAAAATAVVEGARPVVITDTAAFATLGFPRVCYVGVPMLGADGSAVGSLCVLLTPGTTVTSRLPRPVQDHRGAGGRPAGDARRARRRRRGVAPHQTSPPFATSHPGRSARR